MPHAYLLPPLRTAGARREGALSGWHPVDLAARIIDAVVQRAGVDPGAVDDVILGCVMQVGEQAVNVARNAVLASSLPRSVPGTTLDRQCGSSQQALHFAAQAVMSGQMDVVVAGGVESMSRVPMMASVALPAKAGMGHYHEGILRQRYPQDFSQFTGAELLARQFGLTREDLDAYALQSHRKAALATQSGAFTAEILPVEARPRGQSALSSDPPPSSRAASSLLHTVDEGIRFEATAQAMASVKTLQPDGLITAANASQICDGASACVVVSEAALKRYGLVPMARVHHMSVLGHDPVVMLDAPLPATMRALGKAGMRIEDIDLFEVNEAFAPVPLAWLRHTAADPDRLNIHGGAIALGHPLGASGTKLLATLLHALVRYKKRWGLQTMCEGGGMANVTILENLHTT